LPFLWILDNGGEMGKDLGGIIRKVCHHFCHQYGGILKEKSLINH
jgi:hypothetical protein